jgi:hypothetical protein
MPAMLHVGPNAVPCQGGGAIAEPWPPVGVNKDLADFVGQNLPAMEIIRLGTQISRHHGHGARPPRNAPSVRVWFANNVAGRLSAAEADRYLAELRRRKHAGLPLLRDSD